VRLLEDCKIEKIALRQFTIVPAPFACPTRLQKVGVGYVGRILYFLHVCHGIIYLQMAGVTVKDVDQQDFVKALAAHLKK